MPLYKEQGIVLRAAKLGEADKIVTILTQGSGKVRAVANGKTTDFAAIVRIDTPQEAQYYANGGILQYVLRQLLATKPAIVHA